MRSVSRHMYWQTLRFREQAHSHRVRHTPGIPDIPKNNCGSELARECGVSAATCIGRHSAFVSKLTPTGFSIYRRSWTYPKQLWERACSRMRSVSRHMYWQTLRFREQAHSHRVRHLPAVLDISKTTVGASLLAKAMCQPPHVWQTLRFREQAHSHRLQHLPAFLDISKTTVGASLLAKAMCQPPHVLADTPLS